MATKRVEVYFHRRKCICCQQTVADLWTLSSFLFKSINCALQMSLVSCSFQNCQARAVSSQVTFCYRHESRLIPSVAVL